MSGYFMKTNSSSSLMGSELRLTAHLATTHASDQILDIQQQVINQSSTLGAALNQTRYTCSTKLCQAAHPHRNTYNIERGK